MSSLTELNKKIALCQECEIAKLRKNVVPGEGAENAEIMLIGEAPGWHEDQQGRPFVGAAGKFLDELLISIGLDRSKVYIANVIKCRPPDNRDPLPIEIANCRKWLDLQMEIIAPRMIVTLGRFSMSMFFEGKSISKIHGTAIKKNGILCFAMYHPAAALHQQNLRTVLKQDMLKIPPLLEQERESVERKPEAPPKKQPEAKQLNMFDI
ncbi:MAG: uracil-DNA glycosylase [Dehalococcoidales bacterium]|nr:uracil-DNA glycosylase [Dehalococcoidales bacterium]